MNTCKADSKKPCMTCNNYDYCDRAKRCDGNCGNCDDELCENNPLFHNNKDNQEGYNEFHS